MRLAILTLLALAAHVPQAPASEITIEEVLTGIAAVETGYTRHGIGSGKGTWSVGQSGEVSPWQIHPSVLRDLGLHAKSARINRDIVYAESIARLWLGRLYIRFGNWPDSVAAWNGGPRGLERRSARDYSDRVMNIATDIAHQPHQQTE